jgi:secreted trypsin-like serine protease
MFPPKAHYDLRMVAKGRGLLLGLLCALTLSAWLAVAPAHAGKAEAGPVAKKSIIGGGPANFANWPYAAAIFRKGRFHCSGEVIAPTKVLTAAHCIDGFNPANLGIVTGRFRLSDQASGQGFGVAAAVPHPDYHETQIHDIGVITLTGVTTAEPIALPTPEEAATLGLAGQFARVAGYGARNPFGFSLSKVLKEAVEQVRSNPRCRRAYGKIFKPATMICALGRKIKKYGRPFIHETACTGDSGGPLVADTPQGSRLIGTVSFGGSFCGLGASPTVYSRVSDSLPFIQSQL